MTTPCLALVLAAGEGTRMRSSLPKVMHKVAGSPMLHHVLRVAQAADCSDIAVVAGNGFDIVTGSLKQTFPDAQIFEQKERLGTGHAVLAAQEAIERSKADVLVLFGDTPLLRKETLIQLRDELEKGTSVVVLGFYADEPDGYGRLLENDGKLEAIREHKDASEAERQVKFCNGGIMGLAGASAMELLHAIGNDNANQEYYLTDVVEIANAKGLSVIAIEADEAELIGVNTRNGLAEVEAIWQNTKRQELMTSGVTMQAPETVFFSADTLIEPNVEIEPNVVFGPNVSVKTGTRIRAFSHLEGAHVGENAEIGPYARLRPGSDLDDGTKVGNFVEIKNAKVHVGAKVNHLTYIGDAEVGAKANIGAGTITCNYDGMNKHKTTIGAGAFVGSNSSLVAPVTIGDGAYVASGSVITQDIPDNGMGIGRGRQSNIDEYANVIRDRNAALKASRNK
jgi:bifunctional UDP-N-acetylglucosamine pyrophosphorylase/glucosamine-1-phosphate N-acetyltransferase